MLDCNKPPENFQRKG